MPPRVPEDRFPIEIFETIIDVLAGQVNSFPSLKACSLVCHDFLPLTRKHLFATMKLNFLRTWGTSYFVSLISRSPIIAKYVRTLDFCMYLRDSIVKGLPEALRELTMLKSLSIYRNQVGITDPWNWERISLPLRNALLYLFHLPTLSHLALGPFNEFPIPDLAFHSKLKYLNIRDVRIAPVHPDAQKHAWPARVFMDEVDDLCTGRNANGTLVIDLRCHDIKEFQLDIAFSDKTKALFARCSQLMDIRTYKLDHGQGLMLIKGFGDTVLPALQTLQHLHIHFTVNEEDNHELGGLPAEFNFIAGKNVIESISIFVKMGVHCECGVCHEWSELDRALTQNRPGWPNLKNVTVGVRVSRYEKDEDLRRLPETQLKGLARSEDIQLNFEVTQFRKHR